MREPIRLQQNNPRLGGLANPIGGEGFASKEEKAKY
jgi:hypothetical protein